MVVRFRDVNISYVSNSKKRKSRKRKRISFVNENEMTCLFDKISDIRAVKRLRRRKGLINVIVEVEYKEKNEDGEFCYLGWLIGTIIVYNFR